MAITQIKSEVTSSFLQPALGGTVNIITDPGIDWLRLGQLVQIPHGGLYTVMNNMGFVWTLRLDTAVANPGQVVSANAIFPISNNEVDISWGGENGKEW